MGVAQIFTSKAFTKHPVRSIKTAQNRVVEDYVHSLSYPFPTHDRGKSISDRTKGMEIGEDEPLQQFNQLSSDQPEAGPSRPRINRDFTSRLRNTVLDQTRTQAPKSGTFSANNDFISLDISDDESTDNNKLDKGKYSNGRDRDDQIPWRGDRNLKRRPDDVNSDARGMARANGSNATSKRTPWINNVNWDDCTNVSHLCVFLLCINVTLFTVTLFIFLDFTWK